MPRLAIRSLIQRRLETFRAVELVGPPQVGKTTLARSFVAPDSPNYFDLENPSSRDRLTNPITTLSALEGLVVIDEVQHRAYCSAAGR